MVDFTIFFFVFIISYLIYKFFEANGPYNFPPGPWRLPFVGNSLLINSESKLHQGFHKAVLYLSQKYNRRILGLRLGSELIVIVFSKDLIKQVFLREEFQYRPDNFFGRLRTFGKRRGIVMTDGLLWQTQRNFAFRHLRNLGFGKLHMESLIKEELQDLISVLKSEAESSDLSNPLASSVLNVLWGLVAGSRFPSSDTQLTTLLDLLYERNKVFDMTGGLLSQLPFLAYIAPEWSGYNLITTINNKLQALLKKYIDEHKASFKLGTIRDFIDAFLHEIEGTKDQETSFTDDQLMAVCLDFFIAGSSTTSSTLLFALLNMTIHQDVQERAFQEIRDVLSDQKIPSLEDQQRLPYVEAVLLESQRLVHVVPLIGPRRVQRDTTLDGYKIPKNTTVLLHQYSIHHNEEFWENSEMFWPERFLQEKNQNLANDLNLFGLGKRRCPGENLAKSFVFLFFTGMLRNFHLGVPPGSEKPEINHIPGIFLAPKPQQVRLTPRDD